MTPEERRIASGSILLSGASPEAADLLLKSSRVRGFDRGATLFLQGEKASAIYIVLDGWVKLYRIAPNGAEAVVGVFTKGRSFGEAVAFQHDLYPVAAEAVTDCRVIRIEADTYLRQIRENPEFAVAVLSATFVHLQSLVAQVEALKAQTGAQRLAEFLLELSVCVSDECEVVLPYDKVLIAGRLGMKPESLSRAFVKLRDHGVAIRQNHASIADIAALRDFAFEDSAMSRSKT
ncbi:Crp/Fnr family transcriptional regulator [Pseudorhodobacter sp. W20_MBD10_FR17]|uniref:Crp/Fnr family transcriptional regulator n=1 Tax=Pseudorhodobacter sp. W20_MBD10_FR17 TaxID=3240266 RepID=UPI003F99786F